MVVCCVQPEGELLYFGAEIYAALAGFKVKDVFECGFDGSVRKHPGATLWRGRQGDTLVHVGFGVGHPRPLLIALAHSLTRSPSHPRATSPAGLRCKGGDREEDHQVVFRFRLRDRLRAASVRLVQCLSHGSVARRRPPEDQNEHGRVLRAQDRLVALLSQVSSLFLSTLILLLLLLVAASRSPLDLLASPRRSPYATEANKNQGQHSLLHYVRAVVARR